MTDSDTPRTARAIIRAALTRAGYSKAQADARISALLAEAAQFPPAQPVAEGPRTPSGFVSRTAASEALTTLPRPGARDEAIVTVIAEAYRDGFLVERAAARAEQPTLDVERLAGAYKATTIGHDRHGVPYFKAEPNWMEFAAEYARLVAEAKS